MKTQNDDQVRSAVNPRCWRSFASTHLSSTFANCRRTISNFTPTPLKIFPRTASRVRICESQTDICFTVDAAGKIAVGQRSGAGRNGPSSRPWRQRRSQESVFARHCDRLCDRSDRPLSYRCEGRVEWAISHPSWSHMRHRHRVPHSKKPRVEVSIEVLEKCLDRLALAIDRAGKRGAVYLPIYERIEAELDALRAKEERMTRARQRLKRLPGRKERRSSSSLPDTV